MTSEYLIEIAVPYFERTYELWAKADLSSEALKELLWEAMEERYKKYLVLEKTRLYIQSSGSCLDEKMEIGIQGVQFGTRLILI